MEVSSVWYCAVSWDPAWLIFTSQAPYLLYYSHIPTAIIALIVGWFVFIKNRKLSGQLLFFISLCFLLWSFLDMVIWTNNDSRVISFFWSIINLLEMLVSVSTLYLSYVFLEKKDAPFKWKLFFGALLLPFIITIPTQYNIPGFDIANCEAEQGVMIYYFYGLEILFLLSLLIYVIKKIFTAKKEDRRITVYFAIGAVCFLASFSGANIVGSLTEHWEILQYGLFGMPIFMGLLVYLIVQYKVFNIRLIAAQALIFAMFILIAAQFLFIRTPINRVLTGVALVLITSFGWWLVRSVKVEIKQKEELTVANAELKHLDEAKSEFISIASHQLRTPLTAIKGYGSMLLDGDFGEITNAKQKDAVQKMFISGNRLITLVENLLNISRIESGRLNFDFEPKQLAELAGEACETLKQAAEDAGLYLKISKPKSPLPLVVIDEEKIRQVLLNFIDNAIKYTRAGGVTVRLTPKEGRLVCCVEDTGMGVGKEEQAHLFKKFSRGKNAFLVNTEGSGLGLYVANMMIEAHQGEAWIESEGVEGKGSKFCFSLPLAESATGKRLAEESRQEEEKRAREKVHPVK